MAIAYVRARPLRMRQQVCMAALVSYCGRAAIVDMRLNRTWRFHGDGADMVHEEVMLPKGTDPDLANPAALANAIDHAEARRMRKKDNRMRWPQICWTLVVALPPDAELTLDESIEATRRLVEQACGSHQLPAHIVIHDPARLETSRSSPNRHAHVSVGLRPIAGGHKIRNLLARPRHGRKGDRPATYVAEGVAWPDRARDTLIQLFGEFGLDNIVDPPAPAPDRHWSDADLLGDAEKIEKFRAVQGEKNRASIYGDAATLVETMLRGRSAMRIGEIHRLFARFVDRESDRTFRANEILADAEIVALGQPAHDGETPRFVTTRRIYDQIAAATDAIEHARRTASIRVISGKNHAEVLDQMFADRKPWLDDADDQTGRDLLIVGTHRSECEDCAMRLGVGRSQIKTTAKAMEGGSAPVRILAPRAECIVDQELAALIIATRDRGAQLVLGYDLGSLAGRCRSLASYAADRLAEAPDESSLLARAGLVDSAVNALRERIVFGLGEEFTASAGRDSLIVCNDPARVSLVTRRLHETRTLLDPFDLPHVIHADGRDVAFFIGEWIVFEQTVYGPRPPEIRAGGFGRVLAVDADRGSLDVEIPGVGLKHVDVRQARPRSAAAIRIREAKRAPPGIELRIEISSPRHAWASILLAAERQDSVMLFVDPAVARSLEELVDVARASLPSPALRSLTPMRDADAEMQVEFEELVENALNATNVDWDGFDAFPAPASDTTRSAIHRSPATLDEFPTPKPTLVVTRVTLNLPSVHERVRSAIAADPHAKEGLRFVKAALRRKNPDRDSTYNRILEFIGPGNDVATALVRAIYGAAARARPDDVLDEEFDLPQSLVDELPADSADIDIWRARSSLGLLGLKVSQDKIVLDPDFRSDEENVTSTDFFKKNK